MIEMLHYPVLLNESIELLRINPNGVYIDGTFGRGGHTQAILAKLGTDGRLIAYDKDIEAVEYGKKTITDKRLTLIHGSFTGFTNELAKLGIDKIDGVLLDLGISSPQIETIDRGFSFGLEADLDMRMDNTCGQTAREWINSVSENDLADVFWKYGEERFSRRVAKNIVEARKQGEIAKTTQLANIIRQSVPGVERGQNPATRCFQAIRIFINNELGDLEEFLEQIPNYIKSNGRVVVISFHSLEDRIVKTRFNELAKVEDLPKWVNKTPLASKYKVVAKKVKPSLMEITQNNRSRSAILRCLEKIQD